MADIRINALATTAASTASDDFIAVDGSANGTRKLNAFSPTFGGNLTVSGTGVSTFGTTGKTAIQQFAGSGALVAGGWLYGVDEGLNFAPNGTGLNKKLVMAHWDGSAYRSVLEYSNVSSGTATLKLSDYGGLTTVGGNLLIGTTTDSGNGKLQLANHTTSAGGIGFGTDTALYRAAAQSLNLDGASSPQFSLSVSGTQKARFENYSDDLYISTLTAGKSIILRSGNATTALTLDSSQNATFSGQIQTTLSSASSNALLIAPTGGADRKLASFQVSGTSNGVSIRYVSATGKVVVNFTDLPTSSSGLAAGDLWNDSGTIKIV